MTHDWPEIEREARAEALAALHADEVTPLEHGRLVAWAECRFGRTDRFSNVHRVGAPFGEAAMTLCGEVVPAAIVRLPLTPGLVRTLGRCRYCEAILTKNGAFAA